MADPVLSPNWVVVSDEAGSGFGGSGEVAEAVAEKAVKACGCGAVDSQQAAEVAGFVPRLVEEVVIAFGVAFEVASDVASEAAFVETAGAVVACAGPGMDRAGVVETVVVAVVAGIE